MTAGKPSKLPAFQILNVKRNMANCCCSAPSTLCKTDLSGLDLFKPVPPASTLVLGLMYYLVSLSLIAIL